MSLAQPQGPMRPADVFTMSSVGKTWRTEGPVHHVWGPVDPVESSEGSQRSSAQSDCSFSSATIRGIAPRADHRQKDFEKLAKRAIKPQSICFHDETSSSENSHSSVQRRVAGVGATTGCSYWGESSFSNAATGIADDYSAGPVAEVSSSDSAPILTTMGHGRFSCLRPAAARRPIPTQGQHSAASSSAAADQRNDVLLASAYFSDAAAARGADPHCKQPVECAVYQGHKLVGLHPELSQSPKETRPPWAQKESEGYIVAGGYLSDEEECSDEEDLAVEHQRPQFVLPQGEEMEEILKTVPTNQAGHYTSVGSVGHDNGDCSACLYVYSKKGCHKSVLCNFCHFRHKTCRRKNKIRPCKGKRDRYRKVMALLEQFGDDPQALERAIENLPASIVSSDVVKQQLLAKMQASPAQGRKRGKDGFSDGTPHASGGTIISL